MKSTQLRTSLLLFLAIGGLAGTALLPAAHAETHSLAAQAYIEGGTPRQVLDLYYETDGPPRPLVIYIHGGSYVTGSRMDGKAMVEPLLHAGFAVALIDYRFSTEAIYPAQLEDGRAAIRWLRGHASDYNLDPARFGLLGHSAGGHLAAMLGLTGDTVDTAAEGSGSGAVSVKVQAVADWAGPADLTMYLANPTLATLLGGATPEKAEQASPIHYVHSGAPPFLLVHGEKDTTVAVGQSMLLSAALSKAGVPATLSILPGQDHDLMARPQNYPATVAFFQRTLLP